MKTVTGALLLLIAEQAYAHANMIPFPNHITASAVLIPVSTISLILGVLLLLWGLWSDNVTRVIVDSKPGPVTEKAPEAIA